MDFFSRPATIDWCEANFVYSSVVAEVANTYSNVLGVALALYGCHFSLSQNLPFRYFVCFTLFAIVGLGSMAFHASLKYAMQLLDEIPMILCVSQSAYILLAGSTRRWSSLTAAIVAFDVMFVSAYIAYPNPVFHQVIFGILMVLAAGRALSMLGVFGKASALSVRARNIIALMLWSGAAQFIIAFAIWNADNLFCSKLARWRTAVGFPCSFLLEGHAWWHVLSATGTYAMLVGITYLSLCLSEGEDRYSIHFTGGALPVVRRRPIAGSVPEKSQ